MAALEFAIDRDLDADVTVLRASGRLDLGSARELDRALAKCLAECPLAVIVDLAGCVIPSTAALAVLPAAAWRDRRHPHVAVLVSGVGEALVDRPVPVLGGIRAYRSISEAREAAEATRGRQPRLQLQARPSVRLPGQARETVTAACDRWGLSELTPAVALIVSELVTNAVCYTQGEITLGAMVRDQFLHLRVRDASPVPPQPRAAPSGWDEHGRGLPIVDHYSSDWGWVVSPESGGKVVWATVRASPSCVDSPARRGPGSTRPR